MGISTIQPKILAYEDFELAVLNNTDNYSTAERVCREIRSQRDENPENRSSATYFCTHNLLHLFYRNQSTATRNPLERKDFLQKIEMNLAKPTMKYSTDTLNTK